MTPQDPPTNFRYIIPEWWDLLVSGPLWMIQLSDLPKKDNPSAFRYACLRQAAKRKRKVSIRFNPEYTKVFVQGGSLDESMTEIRTPTSAATPMTKPPAIPLSAQVESPPPLDYSGIMRKLLEQQDGDPVTAEQLREHPSLKWFVQDCSCKTPNIRVHKAGCGAYLALPLFEHYLKKLPESPEQWYYNRYVGPYAVAQETSYRSPDAPPSLVAEQLDQFREELIPGVNKTRWQASRPVPEPVAEPAFAPPPPGEEEDPEGSWTEHPVADAVPVEPAPEPTPEPTVTGPQVQFTQQPDPVASTPIAKPPVGPMVINWDGHPS